MHANDNLYSPLAIWRLDFCAPGSKDKIDDVISSFFGNLLNIAKCYCVVTNFFVNITAKKHTFHLAIVTLTFALVQRSQGIFLFHVALEFFFLLFIDKMTGVFFPFNLAFVII